MMDTKMLTHSHYMDCSGCMYFSERGYKVNSLLLNRQRGEKVPILRQILSHYENSYHM